MEDTFENNFKEFETKVIKQIESLLLRILLKIHRDADKIIRDNKAVAWGNLVKNLREQVYTEAGKIIGVVGVGANVPYGIYRHEGTKPHFPPIDAIAKWVIQKGLIKDYKGKKMSWKKAQSEGDDEDARAIAFLIARKISKKGTQGLRFLTMALNQNFSFIESQLKTAFK